MILISKVNGELIEKQAQHDDYGHFGAKKQFYLDLSSQLRIRGHQSTPWAAPLTHRQAQIEA